MSLKRLWMGPQGLTRQTWLFRASIGSMIALTTAAQGVIPNEYRFVLFLAFIAGGLAIGLTLEDERSAFVVGFITGYLGYAVGISVLGVGLIASSDASPVLMAAEFI